MVTRKKEAVTPPELVGDLIRAAGEEMVLVGGQALGFWLQRFDLVLPAGLPAISSDTDFLARSAADRDAVQRFARILGGSTFYPNERALTALVGQAYLDINDEEFLNVDVLFQVFGIDADAVRERAVRAEMDGQAVRVMHPLHVLRSRLANLYKLAQKQNPKGVMQLSMAIDMAREFVRAEARKSAPAAIASGRSRVQDFVSEIERMALDDAGRKVARRFRLRVADAIDPSLIPPGPFWERRWPALKALMSPAYAARFKPPKP